MGTGIPNCCHFEAFIVSHCQSHCELILTSLYQVEKIKVSVSCISELHLMSNRLNMIMVSVSSYTTASMCIWIIENTSRCFWIILSNISSACFSCFSKAHQHYTYDFFCTSNCISLSYLDPRWKVCTRFQYTAAPKFRR